MIKILTIIIYLLQYSIVKSEHLYAIPKALTKQNSLRIMSDRQDQGNGIRRYLDTLASKFIIRILYISHLKMQLNIQKLNSRSVF